MTQEQVQVPSANEMLNLAEQLFSFTDDPDYLDMFYIKLSSYIENAEQNRMHKLGTTPVNL